MAFKARTSSLNSVLFLCTLFIASVSFADHELDECIQQGLTQDVRCQMGCLQQKEHSGGGMQPLVPREAYEKFCQQQCEMKVRDPKMLHECKRRCMEDFEQHGKQGGGEQQVKEVQGYEDTNDDEGEQWEEMREDMCEKSCLLQLGVGGVDQQQKKLCEISCQKKLTLQYKKCRLSCKRQPNAKSKRKVKQCQTQCRVKIEQEQQEQLEKQEQEQMEQEQQEQEQQGQQDPGQQQEAQEQGKHGLQTQQRGGRHRAWLQFLIPQASK